MIIKGAFAVWREYDSRHNRFGFTIWLTGCEVYLGKRLYRIRWGYRD